MFETVTPPVLFKAHLSAEFAEIFRVLADLHLLNLLPQTGTISSACRFEHEKLMQGYHHYESGQTRIHHRNILQEPQHSTKMVE